MYTFTHKNNTQNDTKQTIHRTTQKRQYIEKHRNIGSLVRAVPHLCGFYPGICLTNEEKAWKNLSQGSRSVPAGTMKVHKHTIRIRRHNNKTHKLRTLLKKCWSTEDKTLFFLWECNKTATFMVMSLGMVIPRSERSIK
jgi:hypothetical protein